MPVVFNCEAAKPRGSANIDLGITEQGLESEVHMQLIVTVEKR
jgi:hypothetical protein